MAVHRRRSAHCGGAGGSAAQRAPWRDSAYRDGSISRAASRWRRLLTLSVTALLAALGTVIGAATPATAAPAVTLVGIRDANGTFVEGFREFQVNGRDVRFLCMDSGHAGPDPRRTDYTLQQVTAPRLAYLMAKYGTTKDPARAAALNYLVRNSSEIDHNNARPPKRSAAHPTMAEAMRLVPAMESEAKKHAGPYRVELSATENANRTGGSAAFRVLSASDHPQKGVRVTLTITSGNAVFHENGKASLTLTSTSGTVTRQIIGTRNGDRVRVTATTAPLNDGTITLVLPDGSSPNSIGSSRSQRGVSQFVTPALVKAVDLFEHETTVTFAPQVATQTSALIAGAGDVITDQQILSVTSGSWVPGEEVTVSSTLYGPLTTIPAESAAAPTGAPTVGTVTYTASGPGTYRTPGLTVSEPGVYVWQESIAAGTHHSAFTGRFGVAAETTVVKWSPTVTTHVQNNLGSRGGTMADRLSLSEAQPGHTYEIVSTLWGPMDTRPVDGQPVPAGVPVVDTVTTMVTAGSKGTASATSPESTLPASGFYVYTETIDGDDTNNDWNGATVRNSETFLVKWSPEIATQATVAATADPPASSPPGAASTVHPGESVYDELYVAGVPRSADTVIDVALYRSATPWPDSLSAPPSDAEPVATWTVSATGPGTYRTPDHEVGTPGFYAFYATIADGPLTNAFTPTEFPEASESFTVPYAPEVTTEAHLEQADGTTVATDDLTVSGAIPGSTVTVTSTLWGPMLDEPPLIERHVDGDESDQCAPPVTAGEEGAAHPIASVTTEVIIDSAGVGTATTESIALPGPGYYTWTATSDADAATRCFVSDFGVPAETVLLPWTPRIATQASDQTAAIGSYVTDAVYTDGFAPNHGEAPAAWEKPAEVGLATPTPIEAWDDALLTRTSQTPPADFGQHPTDDTVISVTLYGPLDTKPAVGRPIADGTASVGTVTIAARNGVQVTPEIGPLPASGWYVFVASWQGTNRTVGGEAVVEATETIHVPDIAAEIPDDSPATETAPASTPEIEVESSDRTVHTTTSTELAETGFATWMAPTGVIASLTISAGIALATMRRRRAA